MDTTIEHTEYESFPPDSMSQILPLPETYTRIRPWRALLALGLDWSLIAAGFALAIGFQHPLAYLLAAVLIARTQLALAVLMHESAHGTLLPNRTANDVVGQIFTAAPLLLSMFAYRDGHLRHHRAPMASDDPVALVFGIADYPVPRAELVRRLVRDVTGVGYFLSVRDVLIGKHRHAVPKTSSGKACRALVILSIVGINALLFGVLAAFGHPILYLGLWILPALTFLQLFARIRAITEHAGYKQSDDQRKNARSIVRPNWQTFFCGPHAIHYHIEHHQYVRVPFYNLRKVHDMMRAQGRLPEANLYQGYGGVLRDVTV